MKKLYVILLSCICLGSMAQTAVILQHAGSASAFYGNDGFRNAYNAAVSGDTIYLPGGNFYPPDIIDKGLKIFGAGHHPDSSLATGTTTLLGALYLGANADNLVAEGLNINFNIETANNEVVNNLVFRRIACANINVNGNRTNPCINLLIEQCVTNAVQLFNAVSATVRNCILQQLNYFDNTLCTNNIFLHTGGYSINYASASVIRNCVFYSNNYSFAASTNNQVQKNLFSNTPDLSGNQLSGNYFNVSSADMFVNFAGGGFSYAADFHLKNPASYPGTDGTQVGIYGTTQPWKVGSMPVNPHIRTKSIAENTNGSGAVQVQLQVAAQNN